VFAAALSGCVAAAAWGAATTAVQTADTNKKKLKGGYSTEATKVTTTEESPGEAIDKAAAALQDMRGSPHLTPGMR